MRELSFYTDNNLCIANWGEAIAEFTGIPASHSIGKKYYDLLPRVVVDNKDAVAEVVTRKNSISLKEYCFNCLFAHTTSDITISTAELPEGSGHGIRVVLHPHSTCSVAKKLNESQRLIDIGKMASTLAHGVRNPLNAIKGAVVYLRERYNNEETLIEFTKIMEDEILRLEKFISRFLSSSISCTTVEVTDINSSLKKMEVFTSLQAYIRNIKCVYTFGSIPPILINSFHLEQAVLNVINNAIEAMSDGGQLTVATLTENTADKECVIIEISDTGPGIAAKKIDDISLDIRSEGKGFGLFITHEILKYYQGYLEIKSRQNEGTTVRLCIPVDQRGSLNHD